MKTLFRSRVVLLLLAVLLSQFSAFAQKKSSKKPDAESSSLKLAPAMKWRSIGPFRGGRSLAVAGHSAQPNTFYFGATGGGIWKTVNSGTDWACISDGFLASSSVGALAVAESDPNVVYAGMGEGDIRGNISYGDGVYRSTDAGKTWSHLGLKESYAITRIAVHPQNPDVAFVAALGKTFGVNAERGIFRTKDGGKSWEKVLFHNDSTGGADVKFDPENPRILYAALWQAYRNAYSMSSGGAGSGLWKSTDGGDSWENISQNAGLPKGILGKINVAPSPAKAGRVWAIIENENGGVFRSDDAGKTWSRTSDDRNLRQRAWYYSHIYADPKSENTVYVLNVGFHKSVDGGRTFSWVGTGHSDHHDLWIAPENPERMIIGDDGGAEVSYNGGKNWSELDLPTAQFYHVTTDNQFPYKIYGSQQDNTGVGIASRTSGWAIGREDWFVTTGGESGYIAVHPKKPHLLFGGNYGGWMTKLNRQTEQDQEVSVYPENPVGNGAETHKYRFQWTYPIVFSQHDDALYACGNHVFRSTDEGASWEKISPDLTRNDKSRQKSSGGPITKDNTGVETYCTIFAFAESPVKAGVLWAGSDDGLVHVSKDGGKNWDKTAVPNLPEWSLISIIEPSHFDAGTAFFAATRYKSDDQKPYLFKTTDYGATWKKITDGIGENDYTRVIREDPNAQNLLYAGTENGVYVSFNGGEQWEKLQLNLPVTPIHDLAIHKREKDLIAATHGRSFWILDDLTPLHHIAKKRELAQSEIHLFEPRHTYRMDGWGGDLGAGAQIGQNAPSGVLVNFLQKAPTNKELKLEFLDGRDSLIATFSSKKDRKGEPLKEQKEFYPNKEERGRMDVVPNDSGMNRFVWDMRYPDAADAPGVMWGASTRGAKAVPGTYKVRLKIGDSAVAMQNFEIKKDPRLETTDADFAEQFAFLTKILKKVTETHETITRIRDIRSQINGALGKISDTTKAKPAKDIAKILTDSLSAVEEELVQTKAKSGQDLLNFPMKLNNKIAALASTVGSADARPTKQSYAVYDDLSARIDAQIAKFKKAIEQIPAFNKAVKEADAPAVEEKLKEKK